MDWIILKQIRKTNKKIVIIVITSDGSIDRAIQCMKYGAQDFLVKPFNPVQLRSVLKNTLQNHQTTPKPSLVSSSKQTKNGFEGIIGQSKQMNDIFQIIRAAAPSSASIFIWGESGVGKELVANAIHNLSPRHQTEMVSVNCAAIPSELMQSEIFGHVKGAFTGAISNHIGAAERSDKGSLFLDELAEMPITIQTKFLRFLQTKEYQRIGDSKVRKADIRFIAATNKSPLKAIQKGILREDLYYRLSVILIEIPPLRARKQDIMLIATQFLDQFNHSEQKNFKGFTQKARLCLQNYTWPGNIRELKNLIQSITVLNSGEYITKEMLPEYLLIPDLLSKKALDHKYPSEQNMYQSMIDSESNPRFDFKKKHPLWLIEKQAIETAIEFCGGNIKKAAELLEVDPSTLYRKKLSWKEKTEKNLESESDSPKLKKNNLKLPKSG